ncbi:hypothetical protein [Haloprofundus halobius]|uniref:hypothetical protein n=1 Tax=Haloprofundus halobius TaxID=2876194 RepID=UPI001CCEFC3D|nr:hypothetical protein [Haloprofundus halobius]
MGDETDRADEPDERETEKSEAAEATGEIDHPPSEERSNSPVEQTMMDSDAETQDAAEVEPGERVEGEAEEGAAVEPGDTVGEDDGEGNEPDEG